MYLKDQMCLGDSASQAITAAHTINNMARGYCTALYAIKCKTVIGWHNHSDCVSSVFTYWMCTEKETWPYVISVVSQYIPQVKSSDTTDGHWCNSSLDSDCGCWCPHLDQPPGSSIQYSNPLSLALHSLAQFILTQHGSLTPTWLARFPQLPGFFPSFCFYIVPPTPRYLWAL